MSATGEDRRPSDAGTTLIEALVVTAVTVLIGALIFPAVSRALAGLAAVQAEAALIADLRTARARALSGGESVVVSAADDGRGYRLGATVRALPGDVRLSAAAPIQMFADGSGRGGPMTLIAGDRRRTIAVDAVTGLILPAPAPAGGDRRP